jgi:hypothetical protein
MANDDNTITVTFSTWEFKRDEKVVLLVIIANGEPVKAIEM